MSSYNKLVKYEAPAWSSKLANIPSHRVELALSNTPIHSWYNNLPGGFSVSIKRDDLTGCTLTGNKVRMLEFVFADAIQRGCSHMIASGIEKSNSCRATAVIAAQLGLSCHLLLRSKATCEQDLSDRGNLLLSRMCGAHVYLIPEHSTYVEDIKPKMELLAKTIEKNTGEKTYIFSASCVVAKHMAGYIRAFQEMMKQGLLEDFDDIVVATSSGTTACGLGVANYLTGSRLKIHGVCVKVSSSVTYELMDRGLTNAELTGVTARELVDLIDGHIGAGYQVTTEEELDFYAKVASETGIVLDTTYTGKTVIAMFREMENNPERFKGKRVLFMHTGGSFSLQNGCMDGVLKKKGSSGNKCYMWEDIKSSCLMSN